VKKKCGDIMTRDVACCVPQDSVEHAARMMRSEDVGPIPVVESNQSRRLVGIVTDRDLAIKVIAEGRDPKSTPVGDIMSTDPVTCMADDSAKEAINAMSNHQVRRIPIVDDDKRIVGIISQADVATRIGDAERTGDVVEEISQ
jgi:CBS domain-containing protein